MNPDALLAFACRDSGVIPSAATLTSASSKICIIGCGVVGGALRRWFESQAADVAVYDPPKGLDDTCAIDRADVVFVCVPTPYDAAAGFDGSYVLDAVSGIGGEKVVVIKSTVLPGTTDALQAQFPQHRFMFNPEFVREASAYDDLVHPDRQVIGTTEQSIDDARFVLSLLPRAAQEITCGAREAEMAKYVANSFLAVKVSFANEVFDLCASLGIEYDAVREIVAADARIGASHLDAAADGYRGYSGKCLPKDSKSLLQLAHAAGVPLRVLAAADIANDQLTSAKARRLRAPGVTARRTRLDAPVRRAA